MHATHYTSGESAMNLIRFPNPCIPIRHRLGGTQEMKPRITSAFDFGTKLAVYASLNATRNVFVPVRDKIE